MADEQTTPAPETKKKKPEQPAKEKWFNPTAQKIEFLLGADLVIAPAGEFIELPEGSNVSPTTGLVKA